MNVLLPEEDPCRLSLTTEEIALCQQQEEEEEEEEEEA